MNHYGQLAMKHWLAHAQSRFEALDDPTSLLEEALELLGSLPGEDEVLIAIARIEAQAVEQARQDGFDGPIYSPEQEADLERLRGLSQHLVTDAEVERMSQAELRDLLLTLAPYRPAESQ